MSDKTKKLIQDFYSAYDPDALTPEMEAAILKDYGDDYARMLTDFNEVYEINNFSDEYISKIGEEYGFKKKNQSQGQQPEQSYTPLVGTTITPQQKSTSKPTSKVSGQLIKNPYNQPEQLAQDNVVTQNEAMLANKAKASKPTSIERINSTRLPAEQVNQARKVTQRLEASNIEKATGATGVLSKVIEQQKQEVNLPTEIQSVKTDEYYNKLKEEELNAVKAQIGSTEKEIEDLYKSIDRTKNGNLDVNQSMSLIGDMSTELSAKKAQLSTLKQQVTPSYQFTAGVLNQQSDDIEILAAREKERPLTIDEQMHYNETLSAYSKNVSLAEGYEEILLPKEAKDNYQNASALVASINTGGAEVLNLLDRVSVLVGKGVTLGIVDNDKSLFGLAADEFENYAGKSSLNYTHYEGIGWDVLGAMGEFAMPMAAMAMLPEVEAGAITDAGQLAKITNGLAKLGVSRSILEGRVLTNMLTSGVDISKFAQYEFYSASTDAAIKGLSNGEDISVVLPQSLEEGIKAGIMGQTMHYIGALSGKTGLKASELVLSEGKVIPKYLLSNTLGTGLSAAGFVGLDVATNPESNEASRAQSAGMAIGFGVQGALVAAPKMFGQAMKSLVKADPKLIDYAKSVKLTPDELMVSVIKLEEKIQNTSDVKEAQILKNASNVLNTIKDIKIALETVEKDPAAMELLNQVESKGESVNKHIRKVVDYVSSEAGQPFMSINGRKFIGTEEEFLVEAEKLVSSGVEVDINVGNNPKLEAKIVEMGKVKEVGAVEEVNIADKLGQKDVQDVQVDAKTEQPKDITNDGVTNGVNEGVKVEQPKAEEVVVEQPKSEEVVVDKKKTKELDKSIAKSKKIIISKNKKGLLSNVSNDVMELTSLPLHKIKDPELKQEVNDLMTEVGNRNVSVYTPEKIADVKQRVLTSLEKNIKEPVLKTAEEHTTSITKLAAKVDKMWSDVEIDAADFTAKPQLEKLRRGASGILRSIENRRNELERSSLSRIITEEEYAKAHKELKDIETKFNEKLLKADKDFVKYVEEKFAKGKEATKTIKVSELDWANDVQKKAIAEYKSSVEKLKKSDFVIAEDIDNIAYDLNNGYIPLGDMNRVVLYENAKGELAQKRLSIASEKINKGFKTFEEAGFIKKNLMKLWSKAGSITTRPDLVRKLRSKDFGLQDTVSGTKNDGIFFGIKDGVVRNETDVRDYISALASGIVDIVKPSLKDLGLSKEELQLLGDKVKSNTKARINAMMGSAMQNNSELNRVGMYMVERRYVDKYGESFMDAALKDAKSTSSISKNELANIKKAFDSMPKKEDGSIDLEATYNSMNSLEKKLFKYAEEQFNEMGDMQQVASESNGVRFIREKNYAPFLRKDLAASGDVPSEVTSMLNPKMKSDRGKEQTSKRKGMVETNLYNMLIQSGKDVSRDYYMTTEYKKAAGLFKEMINSGDANLALFGDAHLRDLEASFNNTFSNKSSRLYDAIANNAYAYMLLTLYRLPVELSTEVLRTAGTGTNIFTKTGAKGLYGATTGSVSAMGTNLANSLKRGEKLPKELNPMRALLEFTNSPFKYAFDRQGLQQGGVKDAITRGKEGFGKEISRKIGNIPMNSTLVFEWIPSFGKEFKKITGKDFDYSKANSKEYLEANKDAILNASAQADKTSSEIKGVPSKMAQRTLIQFMPEFLPQLVGLSADKAFIDANVNPTVAKWNAYMTNFMNREWTKFNDDMSDALLGGTNQGRLEASRNAAVQFASGVYYSMAAPVSYALYAIATADETTDDGKETIKNAQELIKSTMTWEGVKDYTINNTVGLTTGKYGQTGKIAIMMVAGQYKRKLQKDLEGASKEEKEKIKEEIKSLEQTSQSLFYQSPITFAKYGGDRGNTASALATTVFPQGAMYYKVADIIPELMQAANDEELSEEQRELYAMLAGRVLILTSTSSVPFSRNLDKLVEARVKDLKKETKSTGNGR